ncbi:MAG: hypothetical protein NTX17_07565 [Candidatus Eisenbacteria bacterium]|nr:hypothetical protein [Candidatus Eisenbacteria bacterium]
MNRMNAEQDDHCCCICDEGGGELVKCAASGFSGHGDHWVHPECAYEKTVGFFRDIVCSYQCWLDWDD